MSQVGLLEAALDHANQEAATAKAELNKPQEADETLSAEVGRLRTELASLADSLEETQQAAADKESDLQSLQAEAAALRDQLAEAHSANGALQADKQAASQHQSIQASLQQQLEEAQAAAAEADGHLQKAKQEGAEQLSKAQSRHEADLCSKHEALEQLQAHADGLQKELKDASCNLKARSEELASARAIADELQQKLEEARAEHQELTEKLAAANKANEEAAQEASKANEKLQQQLQASEKRSAQLEEELLQARKLLESQQQASRRSQEVNETVRAGMAAEVGRLAHESKHASEALAREQEAALSAVKKLEEQLEIQPRESVDPENLARRRSEALEAVQKLEEEVIACKLSMADRIEGRIAAEARAADFAIDADVANLKSQRTSQQLSRASAELERTRRDSADTFEQLQRSSAELRRSSAELQRMRRPSGSLGPLQSLDEGTEKAVQLVLQIISDTATTGTVPGIDQAMFTKLAKENESLKGRIGELGSLLSSNTIGASSARRPSTSGDAEPKPDVKLHDMANTTQEMWEATASLDQPSGSKAESSVTGKEDLLQGPSETTSESTESSLLDNVPSGACEHDDTSFLTRPASHSGASSSTAKQPQEEDSAQEGHAAEDVSISSQQASRAATFAKKLPSHQELVALQDKMNTAQHDSQEAQGLRDQLSQLQQNLQLVQEKADQAGRLQTELTQLEDATKPLREQSKAAEALQSSLTDAQERLADTEKQLQQLDHLRDRSAEMQLQLQKAETTAEERSQQLDQCRSSCSKLQAKLKEAQSARKEQNKQLDALTSRCSELQSLQQESQPMAERQSKQLEELKSSLSKATSELQELHEAQALAEKQGEELGAATSRITTIESELQGALLLADRHVEHVASIQQQLDEANASAADSDKLHTELVAGQGSVAELRNQVVKLESALKVAKDQSAQAALRQDQADQSEHASSNRIVKLQIEVDAAQGEVAEAQTLRGRVAELESAVAGQSERADLFHSKSEALRKQLDSLQKQHATLQNALSSSEGTATFLQETADQQAEQVRQLTADVSAHRQRDTDADSKSADISARLNSELAAARQALSEAKAKAHETQQQLEDQLEAEHERHELMLDQAEETQERLKAELAAARDAMTEAEQLEAQLKAVQGSYAQQRSDLSDQVKQLESEMQAARHQLSQAQAAASQQKDELSSQVQSLQAELQQTTSQASEKKQSINQQQADQAAELEALQSKLQQANAKDLETQQLASQRQADLRAELTSLHSQLEDAQQEARDIFQESAQKENSIGAEIDELQEADEALDGLRTDIAAKEEELTTLRSGYGSLRQRATEVAQPAAIHQDPEPAVTLHITISSQPGQDATSAVVTKPSRPQVSLPEGPSLEAQLPASTLVSPSPANSLPEIAEQSLDAAVASAVQMGAVKATANGHSNEAASKASDSQELAEVKRKFLLVMKKKQQEFVKKVKELEAATEEATSRSKQLEQQLLDFRERGSEQQTARSVATSELTDMHGKHEAEAASLQEQIAQQREAAEQAESRAQAAHTEAAELKASSTADLRMKEEAWQARHTDLEAEVNKLKQDVEAERASRAKLREEVEGERERVKKAITELKRKTDRALRDCKKAEQDAEAVKSKAEAEKEELRDEIVAAEKHDQQAQQGVKLLEAELRDYKARAHLLLKAKDAELKTAADSVRDSYADQLSDAEASAAEARTTADQERQNAHRWQEQLQEGLAEQHRQHELEARHLRGDIAREQAGHQDVLKTCEAWRVRAEAAEARAEALKEERRRAPDASPAVLQQHADELHALQLRLEQLKAEFDAFRQTSEQMLEAKDFQLQQSLETNAELRSQSSSLRHELEEQQHQHQQQSAGQVQGPWRQDLSPGPAGLNPSFLNHNPSQGAVDERWEGEDQWADAGSQVSFPSSRPAETTASGILEDMSFESGLQESALLKLAGKQAAREEELARMRDRTHLLEAEVADLQQEVDLRQQQEVALKEAMRDYEREKARAALVSKQTKELEYLKNILLKLFETGEAAALLPVVAMMLHFSPQELKQCQEAMQQRQAEAAEATAASSVGAGSDAGDGSYLGSWTAWAFGGEGPPSTPRVPSTPRIPSTPG
ncbi:hypothetical protein WJX74_000295 [Apatococcus lobatus]|uniref:GRIP domain-containing protein n=1 Tax=Apatococcus lobatus TaxID=904363 RepID=A0AAW1RB07_9CHLO